jgi:hypothetical protein
MTSTSRLPGAVLLVVLALTGCQDDDGDGAAPGPSAPSYALTIVSTDWNGWNPDHHPTPETTTLPVVVGASATVDSLGGDATFEVVAVDGDRVTVSSDQRLAPEGETGGSNLDDLVDEFTVVPGEETELDTPTLDAGYSYTLTLATRTDG